MTNYVTMRITSQIAKMVIKIYQNSHFHDLTGTKLLYISASTQKHITMNLTGCWCEEIRFVRRKWEIYVINIRKIISGW